MNAKRKKKAASKDEKQIQEYRDKINDSYYIESAIARIALLLSKNLVENAILERKHNG
ncbi:MAG: hypothetical protein QM387_07815 [Spirochaetota bacterium]|jgi:hypothetical protein|nr:hypothetical protein [Spirochaetota bacterium]NMA56463.1 hypothetical protein [Treponema sp.]HPM06751.1 hypothetical protein [Treponemataceae bacterium]